jgi:rRNA maturation endonuclease Nob1
MLGIGGGDKIRVFQCSECSRYANFKFDFCPNCGADMREEAQNNAGTDL